MLPSLNKIKGVHPGAVLKYALDNRNIKSSKLAESLGEHKQTISAIINQRRRITPGLSIKLSDIFGVEKDYFMNLQASYDVKKEESRQSVKPDLSKFRKVLFWDTDVHSINWQKSKDAVIKRIYERGTNEEFGEILRFYGEQRSSQYIDSLKAQIR